MNKKILADISLLYVAFIWGATFVLVQNAISFIAPFSFNGIRFFLASFILFIWLVLFKSEQLKEINRKQLFAGFVIGIWLFAGYALQTFGLLYTSSSKAGFITGLSVVLVPIFTFFILKQRPKTNGLIGVAVATIGLYFLTMGDQASVNKGDILVFFCAISFALHIIFTGKYTSQYPTLLLTVTQLTTVAILSSFSALLFEDWKTGLTLNVILTSEVIVALIITSLFATAFAFLAQTKFQQYTTPTRVALIFAMEPVFAAITAYFWAGERLSYIALFGGILIFIGMIIAELPQRKKAHLQSNLN